MPSPCVRAVLGMRHDSRGAGVNGLLEDKAIRPQDVLRLSMYVQFLSSSSATIGVIRITTASRLLLPKTSFQKLTGRVCRYLTKETRKAAAKEVLARRSPPRLPIAAVEPIRRDRDVNFAPEVTCDL